MSTVIALSEVRARRAYAARAAEEAGADAAAREAAVTALHAALTALEPLDRRAPGAALVGLRELVRKALVEMVAAGVEPAELRGDIDEIAGSVLAEAAGDGPARGA